jgi:hypothetical protein
VCVGTPDQVVERDGVQEPEDVAVDLLARRHDPAQQVDQVDDARTAGRLVLVAGRATERLDQVLLMNPVHPPVDDAPIVPLHDQRPDTPSGTIRQSVDSGVSPGRSAPEPVGRFGNLGTAKGLPHRSIEGGEPACRSSK